MCSELPDYNAGKKAAQAAHAGGDFEHMMTNTRHGRHSDYDIWLGSAGTFGRTIVMTGNQVIANHIITNSAMGRAVIDPTYPWRDELGMVHHSREMTCGWVFSSPQLQVPALAFQLPLL